MISAIKRKLKDNKLIVAVYMKLYGHKKEIERIKVAKETLQNEGLQYLSRIEEVLTKENAKYFVNFGSLLGLLRSGNFISWDTDIDFGIYIDKNFSWSDLETAMNQIGMTLARQFSHNGMVTEQTYKTSKLSVDFFVHVEDEQFSYEYGYFWKKDYRYHSLNDAHVCMFKMYKFPGITKVRIKEKGIEFSAPVNADKYLASIYTEDWKKPNPNWVAEKGPAWNELQNTIGHAEFF